MLIRYLLKGLLLPPAGSLLLMLAGFGLRRRHPRLGAALLAIGLVSLWLLSLPWTAGVLLRSLEQAPVLDPAALSAVQAEAIVVLSAGRYLGAAEYGQPHPDGWSLQRLEYAAWLARRTDLPVTASGGAVFGDGPAAASLMADSLRSAFGIGAVQVEAFSRTTWENAVLTRALFDGPAPRILLVTHAWHMPRAAWAFRQQGFDVVPAPTRLADGRHHRLGVLRYLPSAQALADSSVAVHEWLGLLFYRTRHAGM